MITAIRCNSLIAACKHNTVMLCLAYSDAIHDIQWRYIWYTVMLYVPHSGAICGIQSVVLYVARSCAIKPSPHPPITLRLILPSALLCQQYASYSPHLPLTTTIIIIIIIQLHLYEVYVVIPRTERHPFIYSSHLLIPPLSN